MTAGGALGLLILVAEPTDFGVRYLGRDAPLLDRQGQRVIPSSAGALFRCVVASITDGDTLRCTDGTRVRLAGIDAPEISACSKGRKCVDGDGFASKRSLETLASGRTLTCRRVGTSYNRAVAFCFAGRVGLSCAQVRARQAVLRYENRDQVCR